jgi:hypothetical protein
VLFCYFRMAENSQVEYYRLSSVRKHTWGKGFHMGKKMTIINVYRTLLKDRSRTAALDIAEEMASSVWMATSNMFKTLNQFKSTGKVHSQPPTPKESEIK